MMECVSLKITAQVLSGHLPTDIVVDIEEVVKSLMFIQRLRFQDDLVIQSQTSYCNYAFPHSNHA